MNTKITHSSGQVAIIAEVLYKNKQASIDIYPDQTAADAGPPAVYTPAANHKHTNLELPAADFTKMGSSSVSLEDAIVSEGYAALAQVQGWTSGDGWTVQTT